METKNRTLCAQFLAELEAESGATRKCVERVPAELYEYKPHEKSMLMGYLTLIVAEIPSWITAAVEIGEIDFVTWKHEKVESAEEMARLFDTFMEGARKALTNATDEDMEKIFTLRNGEQVLMTMSVKESVSSSINHLVHHRGQLSVYLRLNNIAVPSIYGPTADEKNF